MGQGKGYGVTTFALPRPGRVNRVDDPNEVADALRRPGSRPSIGCL
jgi:hypothetical protein